MTNATTFLSYVCPIFLCCIWLCAAAMTQFYTVNYLIWCIYLVSYPSFPWQAPPSAPKIYLKVPPNKETGQWALLCLTGGFYPSHLTLTWTYQGTAADIDHLSVINCTLPAINLHSNLSDSPTDRALLSSGWLVSSTPPRQPQCFQMMNNHSGELYLFSVFFLPQKLSLDTGITFTCGVQDHPAMNTSLTASFTWGKKNIWVITRFLTTINYIH